MIPLYDVFTNWAIKHFNLTKKDQEEFPEELEADLYHAVMFGYALAHQHIMKEQKLNEVEKNIQEYIETIT